MLPSRKYFNPRSPHGERQLGRTCFSIQRSAFQSTLPARGATAHRRNRQDNRRISIHAPRTGSDGRTGVSCGYGNISIHAPRTGSDHLAAGRCPELWISIHAPRTGSDIRYSFWLEKELEKFQSTLPARGATSKTHPALTLMSNFNPRSPHGERQLHAGGVLRDLGNFNPRSPHGERLDPDNNEVTIGNFNPRSPHGERLCRCNSNRR